MSLQIGSFRRNRVGALAAVTVLSAATGVGSAVAGAELPPPSLPGASCASQATTWRRSTMPVT